MEFFFSQNSSDYKEALDKMLKK